VSTLVGGCSGGPTKTTEGSAGGDDTVTSSKGTNVTSGEATAYLTGPTSGSSSTTAVVPLCPNGFVDPGEQCDDGNHMDGDGCNVDCVASGTLLWEYHATGKPSVYDVTVASDGNVVVGGSSRDDLTRPWIARFNQELIPEWSEGYGDRIGVMMGVAVRDDAIFAVGGIEADEGGGQRDAWVVQVDLQGGMVWEKTSEYAQEDYATEVVIASDGNIMVSGLAVIDGAFSLQLNQYKPSGDPVSAGNFPTNVASNQLFPLGPGIMATTDAVVIAFFRAQAGGTPEVIVAYPPAGGEPTWVFDVPQTNGYVLGVASIAGDIVTTGRNLEAFVVRRVATSGTVVWSSEECVGQAGREVAVDSDGNIVAIGEGAAAGGRNIRLCKFSAEGGLLWGKDIDSGFGDDIGYTVAIGPGNRIVAGGSMSTEQGARDGWLAIYAP